MKNSCLFALLLLCFQCHIARSQAWAWDSLTTGDGFPKLVKGGKGTAYQYFPGGQRLVRYSSSLKVDWQLLFPNSFSITSVASDADTTVLVTGVFQPTVGIQGFTLQAVGGMDMAIVNLSQNGVVRWVEQAGSRGDDWITDICAGPDNYYVTGRVSDTSFFGSMPFHPRQDDDIFLAKYFKSGALDTVIFSKEVVSNYYSSAGWEVECDRSGNVALLAAFANSICIGTDTIEHWGYMGGEAPVILKFDSALALQWHVPVFVSPGTAHSLRTGPSNEIVFVEYHTWKYLSNPKIRKISAGGGSVTTLYNGPYGYIHDLSLDSCGNVYFTGRREKWTHSGIPPTVHYLHVGQVSLSGNLHWLSQDSSLDYRCGLSLIDLSPNNCLVAGHFADTISLVNQLTDTGSVVPTTYWQYWGGTYNYNGGYYLFGGQFLARLQTTVGLPQNMTGAADMQHCAGPATSLHVTSAGGIAWYNVPAGGSAIGTGPFFVSPVLNPGIHTYYAEANSCTMTTGRLPITVTVMPSPTVTVASGYICVPNSFTISPAGAQTYFYSSGGPVVTPTSNATYTVYGQLSNGCADSALCHVTVTTAIQPTINTSIHFMCYGQTAVLSCGAALSYTWSNGQNSPTIAVSPTVHTHYSVTVVDTNGCRAGSSITQFVTECLGLDAPDASELMVWPNPATETLYVSFAHESRLEIRDVTNALLVTGHLEENGQKSVSIQNLAPGVYFISIIGPTFRHTRHIVKQ